MSVLCQMAWSGKNTSRSRSVTVGTIANSDTPSRVTSTWRHASLHRLPGSASGRVALFPVDLAGIPGRSPIMNKRFIVRLSDEEREQLEALVAKGKAAARKLTRARI